MKGRSVLTTFIIIVLVVAGVLYVSRKIKSNKTPAASASPSVQQTIQNKFPGLTVPTGETSVDLKDVSGGGGMGIATKTEILADLPTPAKGQFYQGWLEDSTGKTVLLGTLVNAKGGWILNFNSSKYPGYNKIIVTLGKIHILEGSF